MGITATELAKRLDLSKGRISQLVAGGQLDGCYSGAGRERRFDLAKCADALQRRLDPGQMMGNGTQTRRRLKDLAGDGQPAPQESRPLAKNDPDRYELARTQKAEEEARKLRRQNAEAEGTLVLASEAQQQVARLLSQEIAQFESMLRDGARNVADRLGVDYKTVRQILIEQWRAHRGDRAEALAVQADNADQTEAERAADF